jgi:hypothetical protein
MVGGPEVVKPGVSMTTVALSSPATKPPLNIFANETCQQIRAVGFEKPVKSFLKDLVSVLKPSPLHERIDVAVQLIGDFRLNDSHLFWFLTPTSTASAPCGLKKAPEPH